MATWRQLIEDEIKRRGTEFPDTFIPADLNIDKEFDNGYGGTEGEPFTAWSDSRVYFPVVYDGSEWVESAPRNPCDEVMEHVGGG